MNLDKVTGIIPPIVTPFTKDGEIDEAAFRNIVKFNLKKKVHGVCVGGSSGEGHLASLRAGLAGHAGALRLQAR